jgi:hypothetical protein
MLVSTVVRPAFVLLVFATLLLAADKKLPLEEATNEQVDITANAILDRDQIKQEIGYDVGADVVVVRVSVRNVTDKPVPIDHEDFLLISNKDGQRSEPYEPGQLAGNDSLIVTPQGMKKGGRTNLGIGLGGIGMGGAGNSAPVQDPNNVKVENKHDDRPNPLLDALAAKILPEKPVTDTVSGLLYFQIVGKVKPKDLEFRYKGPAGTLALRFKP